MSDRMSMIELNDEMPQAVAANPDYATRQEAARLACESMGITWPETILPPGTALYTSGEEVLKADRAKWAKLPYAADAIPAVKAALVAEDRRDFEVMDLDLRLDGKTAKVVRAEDLGKKPGMGYSEKSFSQLCARIPELSSEAPRSHAKNLLYLDADLRATHFGRMVERSKADGAEAEKCLIRTKITTNGQRVVRAVLSERYADVSDVHVAEALAGALNGEGKVARLDYRPGEEHSQFEVIYPSEIAVPLFKVGDVHKAVILIGNSETGQGCLTIQPGVVRARCANLTLSHGFGVTVNLRHLGSADRVRGQLKAAIAQAAAQVQPLVEAIVLSASVPAPKKTPADLFASLAKHYEVPQSTATAWKETYEAKYLPQYGANLWSVTSAITDAAQKVASNWWEQHEQEEMAADLLAKQFVVLNAA